MAVLPSKLVDRLNKTYDLGEYNFGDILQACFDSIGAQPPAGSCLTVPSYASDAAAEAVCGQVEGNAYYNSTSKTFKFWNGTTWADVDPVLFASLIANNAVNVTVLQGTVATMQLQLTNLENDFTSHNHDGLNSQPILIKDLISTGDPAGYYYFSDGAGNVDCGPIPGAAEFQLGGVTVDTGVTTVNFSNNCFVVTQTAAGEVLVDSPSLDALKITVGNNSAAILAATTAITAANAAIGINTTSITNNTAAIAAHTHDGVDSAQIEFNDLLSQNGAGIDLSLNSVPCADGSGGWTYVDKTTLGGTTPVQNRFETKSLGADIDTNTPTVADLSWATGLTIGQWYEVGFTGKFDKSAGAPGPTFSRVMIENGGSTVTEVTLSNPDGESGSATTHTLSSTKIFQATGTDLTVAFDNSGVSNRLSGGAAGTHIYLKELLDEVSTAF